MRLPHVPLDHERLSDVDIGLIGVPWDSGTTNRPGPRHGPRQLRDASTMIRAQHATSGMRPFEAVNCAVLGDVGPNPADIMDSMKRITAFYDRVKAAGIRPLTAGGDHLTSFPVLRALAKDAPLGMVHFDSHTDLFHSYFNGTMYTHGTPFRRAVEEGLLDPARVVQIGLRGTMYDSEDRDFAAGTGTPEVGGPNSFQALQVVRELEGLDIAGADLVEVSPPFDTSGGTAFLGASIMFELLCVMAGQHAREGKA